MERRASLNELIRNAGVTPVERQPCLPSATQPLIVASEDDHAQARNILLDRRVKNPESKGGLKSIFKKPKEKGKAQELGQFSQDELDQALSAVISSPTTGPGLIQSFLSLGAKVNIIETPDNKKKRSGNQPSTGLRRRSTVLQQAASLRKADGVHILASSGADQTTLDEGLKAALAANDQACVQEILRHGADLNKFPNALANAVRSNDLNFVRLLLRAPKPLRTEVISSCLPAAVQQTSDAIISLLLAYGADPNFDSASALNMAIGKQSYKLVAALVAGPIRLTQSTLQRLLDTTMRLPTPQATLQFLQLLLCCGLSPDSRGLSDLLICIARNNDTAGAKMMLSYGVSTATNDAECLKEAITNSNWTLIDAILQYPVEPQHASTALAVLPSNAPQPNKFHVVHALIQKGATGAPLGLLVTQATREKDTQLLDLLLNAGATVDASDDSALHFAVANKDMSSLQTLLKVVHPSPEVLANLFPVLRSHSASERRETSRLLLEYGARGPGVDQALVDAVADTSSDRDDALITELLKHSADVNYHNGKVFSLAATQVNMDLLRLLCKAKPRPSSTSPALLLAFDTHGGRHSKTLELIDLLLSHGSEKESTGRALQIAINGGPGNIDIIQRLLTARTELLSDALEQTILLQDPRKKAAILEALLKMNVTQEALNQALVAETRHVVSTKDVTSIKLLLAQGASVNHNEGEVLSIAVASRISSLTSLLLSGKHQPSQSSVTRAFRTLFTDEALSYGETKEETYETAGGLLDRGVEQSAIDAALQSVLSHDYDGQVTERWVDLLLENYADVNTGEGACFVFAAQKHSHAIFEKLVLHGPKFTVVVPALLSSKFQDEVGVTAIATCFAHGCTADQLETRRNKTPLLITAMSVYPRNGALIKLLLDHGLDADVSTFSVLDPQTGPEVVPALHWALNQPQKRVSDAVISALLKGGASATGVSPTSEKTALILAACEGRHDIVRALLERGADADTRDVWNKSALFYASGSVAGEAVVKMLAPRALSNDGSLHEAAREVSVEVARVLIECGHDANFPSRLHGGRNALGEVCLNATTTHRSRLRQLLRLLLSNKANAKFRARNEKSVVILALDNAYSALPITEALLETEVWQDLNDEAHMYREPSSGLHYSPYSYVDLVSSPSRTPIKQALLELLRDKACLPVYYSDTPLQPVGATNIPPRLAKLVDKQKDHELMLRHEKEKFEQSRSMGETSHKDALRRNKEAHDAELAAQTKATVHWTALEQQKQQHWTALEQQKHEFEMQRVREAERMKRAEKAAWLEQERDAVSKRQAVEDRKMGAAMAAEGKMIEQRRQEVEHRATVERKMLREKEEFYERNVKRQKEVRQIEGKGQWGSVD
ncbi:ankyrin [Decorospora gaudefroyi]|uniref:Ankyrin n=1 Tax=Decorospora gaudefroyi TaxID=184978 RepID=A0A6A5KLV5_9PLEO|nr:ankyrin [Decorospora gaudefroyi]